MPIRNRKCSSRMTRQECEMVLLQDAARKIKEKMDVRAIASSETQKMLEVMKRVAADEKYLHYGGNAVNEYLPAKAKFYSSAELPDYDVLATDAVSAADEICKEFEKAGFENVEAKSSVHIGTQKIYVSFQPLIDVTEIEEPLYNRLKADSVVKNGIRLAPKNWLRAAMYLELSRPLGDITRWSKVLPRLELFNKYCPLKVTGTPVVEPPMSAENYDALLSIFVASRCVFIGDYALLEYKRDARRRVAAGARPSTFMVLSKTPSGVLAEIESKIPSFKISAARGIDETIPDHFLVYNEADQLVAVIYSTLACHSYSKNTRGHMIGSIDTILSFYLAFLYTDLPYHHPPSLLRDSAFLMRLQKESDLSQQGITRRFGTICSGFQKTKKEIFQERSNILRAKETANRKYILLTHKHVNR